MGVGLVAQDRRCKKTMLSFNLLGRHGRLGNQMFQYAALLAIARKSATDFCIPYSDGRDQWKEHQLIQTFLLPSLKYLGRQGGVPKLIESTFAYDRHLHLHCPQSADLRGNFQTEKYFIDISDDVRREFEFRSEIATGATNTMLPIKRPAISLHVRRGDYLNHPDEHPVCSIEYYAEALSRFPAEFPVLVFSDDIPWCRDEKLFRESRFMFIEGNANAHDLCVMTRCSHHIIANSTFSWWGAWLGRNPEKVVIAPKRWFSDSGKTSKLDTSDLIPSGWTRL